MAFCKVCSCGEKIVFARRMMYPDNCPACGRRIAEFTTYSEEDPRVEEEIRKAKGGSAPTPEGPADEPGPASNAGEMTYLLHLPNGMDIAVPPEGGIIGRTEIGGEELAEYPSVSRKHLRVLPRRSAGLVIEDISTYGTLINGERMEKNVPARVTGGETITLCNVDAQLTAKERQG